MEAELLARALRRCRKGQFRVLAAVSSAAEALKAVRDLKPDVAVVSTDLQDGPGKGLEVLRELLPLHVRTRCIMLVNSVEPCAALESFRNGARGILERTENVQTLYKCIRAVHAGQIWANSRDIEFLLEALARVPSFRLGEKDHVKLARREHDVIGMVANGLSNREIAEALRLSEHTVKNYLFRIFEKLGLSNRSELILYALTRMDRQPDASE